MAALASVPAPITDGPQFQTILLGNKPYASPFHSIGQEICQNLYLEMAQSDASAAESFLVKIPGLRRFPSVYDASNLGACRGLFRSTNGRVFSVHSSGFYEVGIDGSKTKLGTINTLEGPVSMAENGALLMLVDGGDGWIFEYVKNVLTRITDANFPSITDGNPAPTSVAYIDTYFVVNLPNSNTYYWSNSYYTWDDVGADIYAQPYDPAHPQGYWTPLQSGQKSGKPDYINVLINCNNYLWIFGINSVEVHYDTGDTSGQQFRRYQGALLNIGCSAPRSVATYQNSIFFLGTDAAGTLGVFANDGLQPVRISTRGIEQKIQDMTKWSDCIGYTYAQNGHAFYVMQFPNASKTLVYDTVTNAWHERTKLRKSDGAYVRWDGLFAVSNWDKLIMGDMSTSELYIHDPYYYQNDSPLSSDVNYIRCVKTTPITFVDGKLVRYNWIQVICNQGSGRVVDTAAKVGSDPMVQLAWSNDTGVTWSNERSAPLGKMGEYSKRTIFPSAGMGRNRVWRVAMTDPVPFLLVKLVINSNVGNF